MKITFCQALTLILIVAMLWHIYPITWMECFVPYTVECIITTGVIGIAGMLKASKKD